MNRFELFFVLMLCLECTFCLSCFGKDELDSQVCSGNGDCVNIDECYCDQYFTGPKCSMSYLPTSNRNTWVPIKSRGYFSWYNDCDPLGDTNAMVWWNEYDSYPPLTLMMEKSAGSSLNDWEGDETYSHTAYCCFEEDGSMTPECLGCAGWDCTSANIGSPLNTFTHIAWIYNVRMNEDNCYHSTWNYCDSGGFLDAKCTFSRSSLDANIDFCDGYRSDDNSRVCNDHGSCIAEDECLCDPEYVQRDFCLCMRTHPGPNCTIVVCDGVWSNSTDEVICNGRGECLGDELCTCFDDVLNPVLPYCDCPPNYFGPHCEVTTCFGVFSNDTSSVCSTNGDCSSYNNCSCDEHYYSETCNRTTCFGYELDDFDNVCNTHGECIEYNECVCNSNYTGDNCTSYQCFGFEYSDEEHVCSGHGTCIEPNNCTCNVLYPGYMCHEWSCFEVPYIKKEDVCGSHGYCLDWDFCYCFPGYSSDMFRGECTNFLCGNMQKDDSNVCSKRGDCTSPQHCACRDEYEGEFCETWSCSNIDYKLEISCSGHGKCNGPSQCDCKGGFKGDACQVNTLYGSVMAPILSVFGLMSLSFAGMIIICILSAFLLCAIVIVVAILCACILTFTVLFQKGRLKKFGRLKNVDVLLHEQELEDSTEIAHLRIRKNLFEIDYDDIKTDSILGEGGSNSVVFKAKWSGMWVAFKCFKTRLLMSSQNKFDEFEREVEILGSISHPNIIRFYGATMQRPRVGIVMEYASKGEILPFITKFRSLSGKSYPLYQKNRLMREISSAMEFLHSKNVIHRDLKSENVLIDQNENSKLMDFGLSRVMDRMSMAKTTRVGTNVYMAPEIVSDEFYSEKCDVFSFAVLMFIVYTENENPYHQRSNIDLDQIELKVANDPSFRPDLGKLGSFLGLEGEGSDWFKDVIRKCWSHNPEERYSFEEISKLFDDLKRVSVGNTNFNLNLSGVFSESEQKTVSFFSRRSSVQNGNNISSSSSSKKSLISKQDLKKVFQKLSDEQKVDNLSNEALQCFRERFSNLRYKFKDEI